MVQRIAVCVPDTSCHQGHPRKADLAHKRDLLQGRILSMRLREEHGVCRERTWNGACHMDVTSKTLKSLLSRAMRHAMFR